MFNCDKCKKTSHKPHRIVSEKRPQSYNNHGHISLGWEVVKEVNLCDECYKEQSTS